MKTLSCYADKFFDDLDFTPLYSDGYAESDKQCFRKVLSQFLSSGDKSDAFCVYFCFSEIFKLFGKGYGNTQKLLELLSDHEYHSGELLAKHRDHYSHSAYVFAIGLAIYANDSTFRSDFLSFYSLPDDNNSRRHFMYLWGMASLFHDIGYPFQLAHEQIKTYTSDLWGKSAPFSPYVSFGNYDELIKISDADIGRLCHALKTDRKFETFNQLFAYGLHLRLGHDEEELCSRLRERTLRQPAFMDHGYFSAIILTKQLLALSEVELTLDKLDVLTAILLHNSLSQHEYKNRYPVSPHNHPLAYLLMLCDELQNWDRQAYGKESKLDPIAWDIELEMGDNFINADYIFESCTAFDYVTGLERINKHFDDAQTGRFVDKIIGEGGILKSDLKLKVTPKIAPKAKRNRLYASENNFINLCDFARAIHASYCKLVGSSADDTRKALSDEFDSLSLEFKISNIEQAKSYANKLELINCFFSSKDLDYPVITDFRSSDYGISGSDNLGFLCREEHVRWVKEKLNMGWKYGTDYSSNAERNSKKIHKDIVPYEVLTPEEQAKDELMVNNIIPFLKKFGHNIRIYNYRTGRKPDIEITGIGHRFFTDEKDKLKEKIKQLLKRYSRDNRVIVRTCFAYGADQLIAECANEMGITTKAVLPVQYEKYIDMVRSDCLAQGRPYSEEDELRLRHLLAQTVVCKVISSPDGSYDAAMRYLMKKCDKVIVVWDKESDDDSAAEKSHTAQALEIAKEHGLTMFDDIHVVGCHR